MGHVKVRIPSIKCSVKGCGKEFKIKKGETKGDMIERMGDNFWKIIGTETICPECSIQLMQKDNKRIHELEKEVKDLKKVRDECYREIHELNKLDNQRGRMIQFLEYEANRNVPGSKNTRALSVYILSLFVGERL